MVRADHGVVFDYSRDPLSSFLLGTEQPDQAGQWFVDHGVHSMTDVVKSLRSHPGVRHAEIAVREVKGADAFGEYYDFQVEPTLKFTDSTSLYRWTGYAQARSREQARVIALAESLERLGLDLQYWTVRDEASRTCAIGPRPTTSSSWGSNGACFHGSALRALKGALCELLERDAFLSNWYSDRAMPVRVVDTTHRLHAFARKFEALGWEVNEHCWKHDMVDAYCVWISVIRKQVTAGKWNFFIGGGASPRYGEALDRAAAEVLKLHRSWHNVYDAVSPAGRVTKDVLANLRGRLIVYQRPDYIRQFRSRLRRAGDTEVRGASRPSDKAFVLECLRRLTELRIIPLPVPLAIRDHVYCIKAVHPGLQDIDWSTPPKFNTARLHSRYGTSAKKFNRIPHPII